MLPTGWSYDLKLVGLNSADSVTYTSDANPDNFVKGNLPDGDGVMNPHYYFDSLTETCDFNSVLKGFEVIQRTPDDQSMGIYAVYVVVGGNDLLLLDNASSGFSSTTLTFTNDKAFDSADGTEMSTIDKVFKQGDKVVGKGTQDQNFAAYVATETDCFSTTTYTGNGVVTDTPTGIDNTGKSLVWVKQRMPNSNVMHVLVDTERGATNVLSSSSTDQQYAMGNTITEFNKDGFQRSTNNIVNGSSQNYVAWNFRGAPGFFDVVTSKINDGSVDTIVPHSLNEVPGCIITKSTTRGDAWFIWHKSLGNDSRLHLNATSAQKPSVGWWKNITNQSFTIGADNATSSTGNEFAAYLFADTPGLIKCGSYDGTGSDNNFVECGFTPGWVMIKNTDSNSSWEIIDTKRGLSASADPYLRADSASAENTLNFITPAAKGFNAMGVFDGINKSGDKYIYVAIAESAQAGQFPPNRKAFSTTTYTGNMANQAIKTGIDNTNKSLIWFKDRSTGNYHHLIDTERGDNHGLYSNDTSKQSDPGYEIINFTSNGCKLFDYSGAGVNASGLNYVAWNFRAAPKFFDVVTYEGSGTAREVPHSLGSAPGMIIVKKTNLTGPWMVYHESLGATQAIQLDGAWAAGPGSQWNNTEPTDSVF